MSIRRDVSDEARKMSIAVPQRRSSLPNLEVTCSSFRPKSLRNPRPTRGRTAPLHRVATVLYGTVRIDIKLSSEGGTRSCKTRHHTEKELDRKIAKHPKQKTDRRFEDSLGAKNRRTIEGLPGVVAYYVVDNEVRIKVTKEGLKQIDQEAVRSEINEFDVVFGVGGKA